MNGPGLRKVIQRAFKEQTFLAAHRYFDRTNDAVVVTNGLWALKLPSWHAYFAPTGLLGLPPLAGERITYRADESRGESSLDLSGYDAIYANAEDATLTPYRVVVPDGAQGEILVAIFNCALGPFAVPQSFLDMLGKDYADQAGFTYRYHQNILYAGSPGDYDAFTFTYKLTESVREFFTAAFNVEEVGYDKVVFGPAIG